MMTNKRFTFMNFAGALVWAAVVVPFYIYLPLFWGPGGYGIPTNAKLFVFYMVLLFFLVILGFVWVKICEKKPKSPLPGSKRLGTACIVLVAFVAVGMVTFQVSYAAYVNYLHGRSNLRELKLEDVASVTTPGARYALRTSIKTPTLNGLGYVHESEAVLRISKILGETAWSSDMQVPAHILEYAGEPLADVSGAKGVLGWETRKTISKEGSHAPSEHLDAQLIIPEGDIKVPFHVSGYLELKATFPKQVSETEFEVVDDGTVESQEVSFWVFPKKMEPEILRELDMYKRASALIPTLLLACSALMPIFFIYIYSRKL